MIKVCFYVFLIYHSHRVAFSELLFYEIGYVQQNTKPSCEASFCQHQDITDNAKVLQRIRIVVLFLKLKKHSKCIKGQHEWNRVKLTMDKGIVIYVIARCY